MALPFFVRAVPYVITNGGSFVGSFGPFPLNKSLQIRALRVHLFLRDISVLNEVYLVARTAAIRDASLLMGMPLFVSADDSASVTLINTLSTANANVAVDIPCYHIPTSEGIFINWMIQNAGEAALDGIIAPIIDFNYDNNFDSDRLAEPRY